MPTRHENTPVGEELPDPHTPPTQTAPGSAGLRESPEPGHGQFQEAYDADPERAAVGSIAHDDDEVPADEARPEQQADG